MKIWSRLVLVPSLVLTFASPSFGQEVESRLKALEDATKAQQEKIEEQQRLIDELKSSPPGGSGAPGAAGTAARPTPGEPAQAPPPAQEGTTAKLTGIFGGSAMTNPYISLIVNTFLYGSNLSQKELDARTVPGFTNVPVGVSKGFTLESAELFIFAPVDPYLNLYANIPVKESGTELEEAYFVTSSLPAGLQVKGGKFKSGFGRINAQHPHAWDFADIPLNYRAMIGKEGWADTGVQLTYLPSLPVYTQFGMEVLQGKNDLLFNPDGTTPYAFTAFVKSSLDFGENSTLLFGPSFATGKARITTVADNTFFSGNTDLFGFELVYKWKPSRTESVVFQSEYLYRRQNGDLTDFSSSTMNPLKRIQDGIYVQALYQWERWRFGVRYDVLDLFKKDFVLAGVQQNFGNRAWRATGALEFNPSEFSRIRLQYNRDDSAGNGQINNELFFQMLLGIGAHAAHSF
jgi:hypothetical protein